MPGRPVDKGISGLPGIFYDQNVKQLMQLIE